MVPSAKDWYRPSEILGSQKGRNINFRPEHIDWIADNYEILSEGRYPEKTSGYIDNPFAPKGRFHRAGAYFETPMFIISEFNWRLKQCQSDGDIFMCVKCLRYERERILRIAKIDQETIGIIIARVRIYISGRRKSRPYIKFILHYSPGYRQKWGDISFKPPPLKRGLDR